MNTLNQMKKPVFTALVFSILILSYLPSFADGPINFDALGNVTYENGEYFLTIPDVEVGEFEAWVRWKLNFATAGWDLVDLGLTSDVTGPFNAGGEYIYNSEKGVLIVDTEWSNYKGCGLDVGTEVWFVSNITSTTMTWYEPHSPIDYEDNDNITWSRSSGISGDIIGTWNTSVRQNSYSVTVNSDGSFTIVGNIVQCGD